MGAKCKDLMKFTILPISILLICLFQLYFQYSSMITHRTETLDKKDKRNTVYTFNLLGGKYEFNYEKIKEIFDDNALMKINVLKNFTLKTFDNLNEKRENKLDKKQYMLLYIIIYDLIYIIFLYSFFFRGYKSGIIKITMQILKCFFLARRIKKTSPDIFLYEAILNYFDNLRLRGFNLATPEGYVILEFIFNFVLIFDIIWLIILIKDRNNINKYMYLDSEIPPEKLVLTEDKKVEEKNKDIYNEEDKIFSNDDNIITKGNNIDNNNIDNNNIKNSSDENDDNNINNNKDEDDINNKDENIETNNNIIYRSYNDNNENDSNNKEVNNSLDEDNKEENLRNEEENENEEIEEKESNCEENDMNNNQETN